MIKRTLDLCFALLEKLQWLPLLIARVTVGLVFVEAGWGKLHHLDKVIEFFTSLGIPFARYQAPFAAATEFVGGLALVLGVGTRFASVALTVVMLVAIKTAKLAEIHSATDLFGISEFLFIVVFGILLAFGPGGASVEGFVHKLVGKKKN